MRLKRDAAVVAVARVSQATLQTFWNVCFPPAISLTWPKTWTSPQARSLGGGPRWSWTPAACRSARDPTCFSPDWRCAGIEGSWCRNVGPPPAGASEGINSHDLTVSHWWMNQAVITDKQSIMTMMRTFKNIKNARVQYIFVGFIPEWFSLPLVQGGTLDTTTPRDDLRRAGVF